MVALNIARYGGAARVGLRQHRASCSRSRTFVRTWRAIRAWLIETETPFLLLALLAPWWIARHRDRARLAMAALSSAALILATYLAYTVFDDWWYIRFLLPALPVAIVFAVAAALDAAARVRTIAAVVICLVFVPWQVHVARDRQVLDLQALESRFAAHRRDSAATLPANAVVLSVQQSGSIRYHGGRADDRVGRDRRRRRST